MFAGNTRSSLVTRTAQACINVCMHARALRARRRVGNPADDVTDLRLLLYILFFRRHVIPVRKAKATFLTCIAHVSNIDLRAADAFSRCLRPKTRFIGKTAHFIVPNTCLKHSASLGAHASFSTQPSRNKAHRQRPTQRLTW